MRNVAPTSKPATARASSAPSTATSTTNATPERIRTQIVVGAAGSTRSRVVSKSGRASAAAPGMARPGAGLARVPTGAGEGRGSGV